MVQNYPGSHPALAEAQGIRENPNRYVLTHVHHRRRGIAYNPLQDIGSRKGRWLQIIRAAESSRKREECAAELNRE